MKRKAQTWSKTKLPGPKKLIEYFDFVLRKLLQLSTLTARKMRSILIFTHVLAQRGWASIHAVYMSWIRKRLVCTWVTEYHVVHTRKVPTDYVGLNLPILSPAGRTTVYKAFVRPLMEYAHLIWIGAPPSYLQRLDHIQRCALRIIGPGALPSLAIRRTVASLACLYKLHYLPGPPQLLSVLPPRHFPSSSPRTRSEHGGVIDHDHHTSSNTSCLHLSRWHWSARSHPAVLVTGTPSPPLFCPSLPTARECKHSKLTVYRHLRSTNWLWAVDSLWCCSRLSLGLSTHHNWLGQSTRHDQPWRCSSQLQPL